MISTAADEPDPDLNAKHAGRICLVRRVDIQTEAPSVCCSSMPSTYTCRLLEPQKYTRGKTRTPRGLRNVLAEISPTTVKVPLFVTLAAKSCLFPGSVPLFWKLGFDVSLQQATIAQGTQMRGNTWHWLSG